MTGNNNKPQPGDWPVITARDLKAMKIEPSLNPVWTDKMLKTADEQANRGMGRTNAGVDKAFSDFKKLGAKFDKYQLADFITANAAEPELIAELLDEHFRPRTINENGCSCRFEAGEACTRCGTWHALFHGDEQVKNAPPITFAIDGFLQNDAITMIGGLPGHGKTWVMLSMVKALLEGTPLFGHDGFKVNEKAEKVVYLCPESSLTPFASRLKLFGLQDHVRGPGRGRLFCRTISVDSEQLRLDDLRLRHAIEGGHIFLDTAVRFMTGDENSASDQRNFANTLFQLLAAGAKTITAAHHAPKGSENIPAERMSLETILRGTGELGAMVATCWALKQIDGATNTIYVKNVKARDFETCQPFVLGGRPHIADHGNFIMAQPPGMAVAPALERPGRKSSQIAEAKVLRQAGKELADIAEELDVSVRTVKEWSRKRLLGGPGAIQVQTECKTAEVQGQTP